MCLLIWTVFSGERCGPWASCLEFMLLDFFIAVWMYNSSEILDIRKFSIWNEIYWILFPKLIYSLRCFLKRNLIFCRIKYICYIRCLFVVFSLSRIFSLIKRIMSPLLLFKAALDFTLDNDSFWACSEGSSGCHTLCDSDYPFLRSSLHVWGPN